MILRDIFYVLASFFLISCFGTAVQGRGLVGNDGSEYAVKTIQTEHGDIYDCVDFYKQPAFKHPRLKNHNFHPQMMPTSRPKRIGNSNRASPAKEITTDMIRLKDGGCPPGTVPIRRNNVRDNRMQAEVVPEQLGESKNHTHGNDGGIAGVIYALGQTKSDPSKKYYGVGAIISVYNPRALPSQYSSAEIIVRGGSDNIIAGWTVNPSKYRDNKSRFFIYADAGELHCFNSECGFIIVRSDIPLDFVMPNISTSGGTVYDYKFLVYQDPMSGNWWLQIGTDETLVGFWPQRIFEGLKRSASYAACGGEIYSSTATLPPPEMGAGSYPDFAPSLPTDAYCKEFEIVDEAHYLVEGFDSDEFTTDPDNYGAFDTHMRDHHHVVTFGGP